MSDEKRTNTGAAADSAARSGKSAPEGNAVRAENSSTGSNAAQAENPGTGDNAAQNARPGRRPHGPHGPHGGMMPGEKAKDFKGTFRKLLSYMGRYKIALIAVMIFAAGSTVFNIIGPKVLAKATTELFEGMMAKFAGTGGINFQRIGQILLLLLGLYALSALLYEGQ